MRVLKNKVLLTLIIAAVIGITGVGFSYLLITKSVREVLRTEQEKKSPSGKSAKIKNVGSIERASREGWRSVVSMKEIRDIAYYDGKLWLGTSGGLIAVSSDSGGMKVYTRLNGLPDADIASLAVHQNFLYAGSTGGFVMVIRDSEMSYIQLPKECGPVSVLLSTQRGVAIGTGESGVWLLRGGVLSWLGKDMAGADFVKVTSLGMKEGYILVGTYDDGVFVEKADGFAHYTEKDGLPMNHITSVHFYDGEIFVGTPAGWASISSDDTVKTHPTSFVSSIALFNNNLLAGTHNGVLVLHGSIGGKVFPKDKISIIKNLNNSLFLVADDEVFVKTENGWTRVYSPPPDTLSANHITSLLYRDNEVWVGTFENGFDVFDDELKKKKFSQSGNTWAINGFFADGETTVVAHNNGASIYRADINVNNITTADGLVGNRVSAVCPIPGGKVYATESGLTFDVRGKLRSIYAFHGLVNNHVYSCAQAGEKLYVGTLGGISVISNFKVVKSFRPGDSPLKSGWISALAVLGNELYIGTYGDGIMKLSKEKFWTFYDDIGAFEVNQGAIVGSDGRVLVGSTERGLLILDKASSEWVFVREGLTSDSVTAIAVGDKYVYVGTNAGITLIPRGDFSFAKLKF